ncbi:MAG: fibronectin type III domain-containing protein [Firmicutes bacterium]|nr:fibronectin type III domain-containing protein [Bacillota bacterium]
MKKRTLLAVVLSLMLACAFVLTACNNPTPDTTTVPGTPTSFTALAGDAQAVLSWAAPASNGGAEITKYQVTHSDTWVDVSSGTTHTFTGLTNGNQYEFKVRAVNSKGAGEAAVTHATPLKPIQQVAFTGVTANGEIWVEDTTVLTLSFDVDVPLTAADITLTGAAKGALTGSGKTFTLAISNITSLIVTVQIANPEGFNITPASQTVAVHTAMEEGDWEMLFGIAPSEFDFGDIDDIIWVWLDADHFDTLSQVLTNLGYVRLSFYEDDNTFGPDYELTQAYKHTHPSFDEIFMIGYSNGVDQTLDAYYALLSPEQYALYNLFGATPVYFGDYGDAVQWGFNTDILDDVRDVLLEKDYLQTFFIFEEIDTNHPVYGAPMYTNVDYDADIDAYFIEFFDGVDSLSIFTFEKLTGEQLVLYKLFQESPDLFMLIDIDYVLWMWNDENHFDLISQILMDLGYTRIIYSEEVAIGPGYDATQVMKYVHPPYAEAVYMVNYIDASDNMTQAFFALLSPEESALFNLFDLTPDNFNMSDSFIEWQFNSEIALDAVRAILLDNGYLQTYFEQPAHGIQGPAYTTIFYDADRDLYFISMFDGVDTLTNIEFSVLTDFVLEMYNLFGIAPDSFIAEYDRGEYIEWKWFGADLQNVYNTVTAAINSIANDNGLLIGYKDFGTEPYYDTLPSVLVILADEWFCIEYYDGTTLQVEDFWLLTPEMHEFFYLFGVAPNYFYYDYYEDFVEWSFFPPEQSLLDEIDNFFDSDSFVLVDFGDYTDYSDPAVEIHYFGGFFRVYIYNGTQMFWSEYIDSSYYESLFPSDTFTMEEHDEHGLAGIWSWQNGDENIMLSVIQDFEDVFGLEIGDSEDYSLADFAAIIAEQFAFDDTFDAAVLNDAELYQYISEHLFGIDLSDESVHVIGLWELEIFLLIYSDGNGNIFMLNAFFVYDDYYDFDAWIVGDSIYWDYTAQDNSFYVDIFDSEVDRVDFALVDNANSYDLTLFNLDDGEYFAQILVIDSDPTETSIFVYFSVLNGEITAH